MDRPKHVSSSIVPSVHEERRFERSPIVQQLVQFLSVSQPGSLVPFSKLCDVAACDVHRSKYHYVSSAIEILRRDYKIVIDVRRNQGVVRLADEDIPKTANEKHIKRFKNDTRRYQEAVHCADYSKLSESAKVEYGAALAMIGLREAMIQPKFQQDVRTAIGMNPERHIDRAALIEQLKTMG